MKKKRIAIAFWLLMSLCSSTICLAEEVTEERETFEFKDFEYCFNDDGTVTISKWYGEEESVEIPSEIGGKEVAEIGDSAFYGCSNLTSIGIPESVTTIGEWAFAHCYSLTSIELPDSVKAIKYDAFFNCGSLTSIELPDSVTEMGRNPFVTCNALEQITVSPDHEKYAVIDNVLFNKTDKTLICYPCGLSNNSYTIPEGIRGIGDSAFYNCANLTSIEIPESVTTIGEGAFYECRNLTSIELPDSVTTIGIYAFSCCDNLTSIEIPESVTTIGEGAFSECGYLTSIELPDSVTTIGDSAFSGCANLTITTGRDSYAKQYAVDNDIPYTYPDANDWLNN